jgi:hypothetical protein
MKKYVKQLRLCPAVGVAGLSFATANATTAIPPTSETMAGPVELVFAGKVAGSRAEWRYETHGTIKERDTLLRRNLIGRRRWW